MLGGLSFFDFQLFFTNKNKWMSFSSIKLALFGELTQQVGGFRIEAGQRPVWAVCQKQCPQQQQQVELAFG